jgi:ATP-grasp domain-containing protein
MDHDVLIIPAKPDVERDAVAAAWLACGGTVLRLDRFWTQPDVEPERVALYGADTFCLVLAQLLGLDLVSPPDDLLLRAEHRLTKRAIRGVSLAEALVGAFPVFVKPLVPKQFRAGVWRTADDLRAECSGLAPETAVIASEMVTITAEARAWILGGRVVTCAVYEGAADQGEASSFIDATAAVLDLPNACVLDTALVGGEWCVLEGNAAWGAGLNGCDASAAVRCIDHATRIRRNDR